MRAALLERRRSVLLNSGVGILYNVHNLYLRTTVTTCLTTCATETLATL
jgi:hypothetical protein